MYRSCIILAKGQIMQYIARWAPQMILGVLERIRLTLHALADPPWKLISNSGQNGASDMACHVYCWSGGTLIFIRYGQVRAQ